MSSAVCCLPVNRLIIDEIDVLLKEEEFHKVHNVAKYIFATLLCDELSKVLKSQCNGCMIEHPSQLQHICIEPDPANDIFVLTLYIQALEELNKLYAAKLFQATRRRLQLGTTGSCAVYDFLAVVHHYSKVWTLNNFSNLQEALHADNHVKEAVNLARLELETKDDHPFEEWLMKQPEPMQTSVADV